MNRRQLIQTAFAALPLASAKAKSNMTPQVDAFTSPTKFINSASPSILAMVESVAPASLRPEHRAVRIHDFVRDEIAFGWDAAFYNQTASEVLEGRIGFCNTKSTLFVALLRAAGIPARQHFVDINARILSPFIDPGIPYVDHSYTEVMLNGRWLAVDSYIVDKALFTAAKRRLEEESISLGFGVHRDGTCEWTGKTDSFSQFVRNGSFPNLSTKDHGVHDDVSVFYDSGKGVNRLNVFLQFGFWFLARAANDKIRAVRSAG